MLFEILKLTAMISIYDIKLSNLTVRGIFQILQTVWKCRKELWKRFFKSNKLRYINMLSGVNFKTFGQLNEEKVYGEDFPIEKEEHINHIDEVSGTGLRAKGN
ncbi:hypothetical protein CEXT_733391 [Caerostris extrusa]|uniref:Uncharacterized protein n=1 Tax=Caerostris extrusa TaxID=172846 RepID=A0AAV4TBV8_CAEEX|nr:hypothetical protein CEXT_733391 [Caerostris extrusa]